MKKYILKSVSLFALFAVLASCEDDDVVYNVDGGQSLVGFNVTSTNLPVYEPAIQSPNAVLVEVGSTKRTNYDRTFTISVNPLSTAPAGSYTVQQANLVIPAGQFVGTVEVKGNYDSVPTDFTETSIILDLEEVQDADLYNDEKLRSVVTIYRGCFQNPADSYTGYITGSTGSNTTPYPVTLVPVENVDNTWSVTNIWGDFVYAATNDPTTQGQYPYPATIRIRCNNSVVITGTDTSTGRGGTGTFNPNTKVISGVIAQSVFTSAFTVSFNLQPNN